VATSPIPLVIALAAIASTAPSSVPSLLLGAMVVTSQRLDTVGMTVISIANGYMELAVQQALDFVTHDARIAASADRMISMRDGAFMDETRLSGGITGQQLGVLVGPED
jgi:predicted ABC-type transport system involved in lysophospholipase L1 biosynthesis ATPase subunit